MHLTSDAAPLEAVAKTPREIAELVHRMLDKDASTRPGAIEVRQIARGLALDMTSAYESFELEGAEALRRPRAVRPRRYMPRVAQQTDDVVVVDPDALEFGVTEMVPTIRKPRWTPELGLAAPAQRSAITPRAASDEVAGEIEPTKRR
jgi:hypothetical protein